VAGHRPGVARARGPRPVTGTVRDRVEDRGLTTGPACGTCALVALLGLESGGDGDLAVVVRDSADCPLAGREVEVLRLAADGANIATRPYLSPGAA
jgi:hypothetical protein